MPAESLAQQWSEDISEAETPILFSSRDGKWLKPVPNGLTKTTVRNLISLAFANDPDLKSAAIAMLTARGTKEFRSSVALMRGVAYLQGGRLDQALKDSKTSVACAVGNWAFQNRSLLLQSRVLEESGNYVEAVIAAAKAMELSDIEVIKKSFERALNRLDDTQRRMFDRCGYRGLERWMEDNKEKNLPEILRKRPKYYYYYEWMRDRINGHCGALPEPVMDKLLTTEAGDLDTLLKSPEATTAQALELTWVLKNKGESFLETYKTEELSWEEVKYINQGARGVQLLDCEKEANTGAVHSAPTTQEGAAQHSELKSKDLSIVSQAAASKNFVTRKETMLRLISEAKGNPLHGTALGSCPLSTAV